MLKNEFVKFPMAKIYVERDERQRRELNNIAELVESIRQVGLINPLVIHRDGKLRCGERRLTALETLQWETVPVQFVEDLDESQLQLIELEENVKREALSWQDECAAVAKYHELRKKLNPDWSIGDTASAMGMDRTTAGNKIIVMKELEKGNPLIVKAEKYSVAKGIAQRAIERKRDSVLAGVNSALEVEIPFKEVPLLHVDFHDWQKAYSGHKFNFIHCDFPYGVGADKHDQGSASAFGGYADSPDVYWKLLGTLQHAMENVIAPSAHLMFWFSMDYYEDTKDALTLMGWDVNPFPLIWHKSDNSGIIPDPNRGPRRIYETCFHASRGDRKIIQSVSNVFSGPMTKEIHMSEKPIPMLNHFFRMFVDDNTLALDPTCGSGNAIKAAAAKKATGVLGLERDETFYNNAVRSFENASVN